MGGRRTRLGGTDRTFVYAFGGAGGFLGVERSPVRARGGLVGMGGLPLAMWRGFSWAWA
jgi:hypothetical protein